MFDGVMALIKLIIRRDRIKLPLWIVGAASTLLLMVPLLRDTYGEQAALNTLYQAFKLNPAGLFLTGFMDKPSFGAIMTIETVLWWGLLIAFINTFFVIRHTRQNEESGAQELILSGRVRRSSSLAAVLVVASLMNTALVLILGFGLAIQSSWSVGQAWLYAGSFGVFGMVWAAIAAVIAQLVEGSRSANGLAAILIGVAFLLRGIGDIFAKPDASGLLQQTWVSFLSPFGWLQSTRALTVPEWWPLMIHIPVIIILFAGAFIIVEHRDVGAGILPARKGRGTASVLLKSPVGLTWRLQKNVFIGWFMGVVAMAVTIGALVPQMSEVYESSDAMRAVVKSLGGSGALIPAFLSAMVAIIVLMVLAYAIQAMGRLRSEEDSGHLEPLFATAFSRTRWFITHCVVVLLGSAVLLAATGVSLVMTINATSSLTLAYGQYLGATMSYLPLVALFIAGYGLLFALLPRMVNAVVWLYFGFVAGVSWIGPLMGVKQSILDYSILSHFPAAPSESINGVLLASIGVVSLIVIVVAAIGFSRRNVLVP